VAYAAPGARGRWPPSATSIVDLNDAAGLISRRRHGHLSSRPRSGKARLDIYADLTGAPALPR